MKRNTYYPARQADQNVWLANFSNKLPGQAAALGLTPAQVTAAVADCGWLIYVLQTWLPAVRSWALAGTDAANEAQTGNDPAAMTLPVFVPPPLPTGVVAVAPGALTRIFALVQLIKDGGKATDSIASNLGIVGSAQTGPDLATVQPVIAATVSGSQSSIKWGWGGNGAYLDSCEIQVDRGDGKGFVLLTIDTTPNYTDSAWRHFWSGLCPSRPSGGAGRNGHDVGFGRYPCFVLGVGSGHCRSLQQESNPGMDAFGVLYSWDYLWRCLRGLLHGAGCAWLHLCLGGRQEDSCRPVN